jgi:hypothetical protein
MTTGREAYRTLSAMAGDLELRIRSRIEEKTRLEPGHARLASDRRAALIALVRHSAGSRAGSVLIGALESRDTAENQALMRVGAAEAAESRAISRHADATAALTVGKEAADARLREARASIDGDQAYHAAIRRMEISQGAITDLEARTGGTGGVRVQPGRTALGVLLDWLRFLFGRPSSEKRWQTAVADEEARLATMMSDHAILADGVDQAVADAYAPHTRALDALEGLQTVARATGVELGRARERTAAARRGHHSSVIWEDAISSELLRGFLSDNDALSPRRLQELFAGERDAADVGLCSRYIAADHALSEESVTMKAAEADIRLFREAMDKLSSVKGRLKSAGWWNSPEDIPVVMSEADIDIMSLSPIAALEAASAVVAAFHGVGTPQRP